MIKNKKLEFVVNCIAAILGIALLLWIHAKKDQADWASVAMVTWCALLNIPASTAAESRERWRPFYKKKYAILCRVLQLFVFFASALCVFHGISFPMWTAIVPIALLPFTFLLIFK